MKMYDCASCCKSILNCACEEPPSNHALTQRKEFSQRHNAFMMRYRGFNIDTQAYLQAPRGLVEDHIDEVIRNRYRKESQDYYA